MPRGLMSFGTYINPLRILGLIENIELDLMSSTAIMATPAASSSQRLKMKACSLRLIKERCNAYLRLIFCWYESAATGINPSHPPSKCNLTSDGGVVIIG